MLKEAFVKEAISGALMGKTYIGYLNKLENLLKSIEHYPIKSKEFRNIANNVIKKSKKMDYILNVMMRKYPDTYSGILYNIFPKAMGMQMKYAPQIERIENFINGF